MISVRLLQSLQWVFITTPTPQAWLHSPKKVVNIEINYIFDSSEQLLDSDKQRWSLNNFNIHF